MAQILEKAFDAAKRIARTVFVGQPNLFTTSDLNRQFEQNRFELDGLQKVIGLNSDFSVASNWRNPIGTSIGGLAFLGFSYIRAKGISFSPEYEDTVSISLDYMTSPRKYFLLVAKKKIVTYADDSSHEIAGAKFEDSTSKPAANQEVYYDEKIVVSETTSYSEDDYEVIGVLSYFEYEQYSGVSYYSACYTDSDVIMSAVNEMKSLRSVSTMNGDVATGDSYGIVIRKLLGAITSLKASVNSAEEASYTLLDLTVAGQSGSPNRWKIALEGRNLFFSLYTWNYVIGPFTSGTETLMGSAEVPDALYYDIVPFETPIYRQAIHYYVNGDNEVEIEGAFIVYIIRVRLNSSTGKYVISLYHKLQNRYAVKFSDGSAVDLYGKTLNVGSSDGFVPITRTLRIPKNSSSLI